MVILIDLQVRADEILVVVAFPAAMTTSAEFPNSTADTATQVEIGTSLVIIGCPVPATLTVNVVVTVIISVLLLIGVAGNMITLIVIGRHKHLQTNFNRFLMSLCVSDLVSACICSPLWLYRRTWGYDDWQLGQFLCKFYWVVDYGTNFITSLHVLSFCVLRFMVFSKPFSVTSHTYTNQQLRIYIVTLWLGSMALALPHAYFMGYRERSSTDPWPSCSVLLDKTSTFHTYSSTVYTIFFYIPGFFVVIFSCLTTRILNKMKSPRDSPDRAEQARNHYLRRRNASACLQLRLICTCFIVGYVPLSAYPIWTTAIPDKSCTSSVFLIDYWIGVVAYIILRISECLNPVMYNLGCHDMRRATVGFLFKRRLQTPVGSTRASACSPDSLFHTLPFHSVKSSSVGA